MPARSQSRKTSWSTSTKASLKKSGPVKTNPKKNALKGLKKSMTKAETFTYFAETHDLSKKQIAALFDSLTEVAIQHLAQGLPFVIPRLCKLKPVHKPATKAKKGTNPFTGEPMVIKAKPARTAVKILALKDLKAAVA